MYFFSINAKPSPDSEYFGELGGAIVEVWVNRPSHESAEALAIEHVADRHWTDISVEAVLPMPDGPPPRMDGSQVRLYHRARARGVAALWSAWPLTPGDDQVVEIRPSEIPRSRR